MKIRVNGAELYYEVWGQGPAIILVHGNSETHEIFDVLIPSLAKDHTVYAVDSRCHGQSENTERISYELMCDDMIQFIKKLDIRKPIFYGFSDGGVIGLMIAMKEPDLLSKLISSGARPLSDRYEAYSVSGNDQGGHPQRQGLQDDVQGASYKGEGAPKDKDTDGDPGGRARCHQDFPHQKDRPVPFRGAYLRYCPARPTPAM